MKKYKYIYVISGILLSLVLTGADKNDIIKRFDDYLRKYNKELPQEKNYIQTDKTYYKPAETIWYKGFLANSTDNKPSVVSDVVYVELHDPWGSVLEKHEQNVSSGTFDGAFRLSKDRPGGIYKIVSYTKWMKNWGEELVFTKEITVQNVITPRILLKLDFEKRAYGAGSEVTANLKVTDLNNEKTHGSKIKTTVRIGGVVHTNIEDISNNGEAVIRFSLPQTLETTDGILQVVVIDKGIEESISRSIPIVLDKIFLRFFPESGELVEETDNKIAFEALNEFGKGADVSGEIVDESGYVVTKFESFHLGMGAFNLKPKKDKIYYAKISSPAGNDSLRRLPEAVRYGYILSLTEKNADKIRWNIHSSESSNNIYITAHTGGILQYSKRLKLKKGDNNLEVNTSAFPAGIAVFTLFEETNEVAERLVYLNNDKRLNIKIDLEKDVFAPKEEVSLSIETADDKGNPISANIGLSVVDEQLLTMADDKQDNLLSYMLFSSELKGKIQEPAFYFDKDEPKADKAIDYLMLTHGWRRFKWSDVFEPSDTDFKNTAERFGSVYGYVLDSEGKPVQADVFLIELGGRKRIAKLNTTTEGHFVFHNIDNTGGVSVSTKLPNRVVLIEGIPLLGEKDSRQVKDSAGNDVFGWSEKDEYEPAEKDDRSGSKKGAYTITQSFESDAQYMDEVIVIGYGAQRKKSLTSAISAVNAYDLGLLSRETDITTALSGMVSGIRITQSNGAPGYTPNISIRGTSTLINTEPGIIINGIPVEGNTSELLNMLNPQDIESLNVIKSAEAGAVYGSRGANGIIEITTKNPHFRTRYIPPKPQYRGTSLRKRTFYEAPVYIQDKENVSGENSTVYWNGRVYTGKEGKTVLKFKNNNTSSTFRITAEGISPDNGLIAGVSKKFITEEPLYLDAKVPVFAGCGDLVKVPVMMKNSTDKELSGNVYIETDSLIVQENGYEVKTEIVAIPPGMAKTIFIPLRTEDKEGITRLYINADFGENKGRIERQMTIRRINFPNRFGFSGRLANDKTSFNMPDYIDGSLKAEAVVHLELLDELLDGAESIFREPYGCFEQVLSSSFPNVFAMQLLKATGRENSPVRESALRYLDAGYRRSANYEVKKTGGFEWYGGSPAHEMLSAYGLVHYHELKKVYDKVDKAMVQRTLNFLLERRDGKGGFKQNNGRYGFSGAPVNVNNAYIVYAFTETGNGHLIDTEYQAALKEASESEDIYRMALIANAACLKGDMSSYKKLISYFKEQALKTDFSKLKLESTIVRSYGDSRNREAVAYWLLALLKDTSDYDHDLIKKCLEYISRGKQGGSFGNTQATSVCLQALSRYALLYKSGSVKGNFSLDVNNNKYQVNLEENAKDKAKISIDFMGNIQKGSNTITLGYTNAPYPYPYSVNVTWFSATPASSTLCPLNLTAEIASTNIKVNETVRLSVKLKNKEEIAKPMSVAIIGIPGGMSLQPWQLKELQEKEVFDFYEIINDNLVIYYRELGPAEEKIVNLDLKAEIPGSYTGIASSAYVYYMSEHKHWINGIKANISE